MGSVIPQGTMLGLGRSGGRCGDYDPFAGRLSGLPCGWEVKAPMDRFVEQTVAAFRDSAFWYPENLRPPDSGCGIQSALAGDSSIGTTTLRDGSVRMAVRWSGTGSERTSANGDSFRPGKHLHSSAYLDFPAHHTSVVSRVGAEHNRCENPRNGGSNSYSTTCPRWARPSGF